jgi:hypothetical protein
LIDRFASQWEKYDFDKNGGLSAAEMVVLLEPLVG